MRWHAAAERSFAAEASALSADRRFSRPTADFRRSVGGVREGGLRPVGKQPDCRRPGQPRPASRDPPTPAEGHRGRRTLQGRRRSDRRGDEEPGQEGARRPHRRPLGHAAAAGAAADPAAPGASRAAATVCRGRPAGRQRPAAAVAGGLEQSALQTRRRSKDGSPGWPTRPRRFRRRQSADAANVRSLLASYRAFSRLVGRLLPPLAAAKSTAISNPTTRRPSAGAGVCSGRWMPAMRSRFAKTWWR